MTTSSATNISSSSSSAVSSSAVGDMLKNLTGMQEVEALIRSKFASDAHQLREIPLYLLELGGKRIRPALCLLVAQLCGITKPSQPLLEVSAGIELIHMATLLHDDIIDRSPLRRGKPSPHIQFGESSTLLAGDFLLVRAFALCSRLDEFIIQETEDACVKLTEGEVMEQPLHQHHFSIEESLEIAEKKTAALFGLSSVCGAHLAEIPMDAQQKLKTFGLELGVAFQILDDILDVVADQDLLGKKSGGDLIEQKPSIVNVLWLQSGSSLAEEVLLTNSEVEPALVERGLTELRGQDSSVISEARDLANGCIKRAESALDEVVDGQEVHLQALLSLKGLLAFTLSRLL